MRKMWGLHLPFKRRDSGVRSAYRCLNSGCLAWDESYLHLLEVTGRRSSIVDVLRECGDPSHEDLMREDFLLGGVEATFMFHTPHCFPVHCLGPVDFCFSPSGTAEDAKLWMWVHPATLAPVLAALRHCDDATVTVTEVHDLLRFRMQGRTALSILRRVLACEGLPDTSEEFFSAASVSEGALRVWGDGGLVALQPLVGLTTASHRLIDPPL